MASQTSMPTNQTTMRFASGLATVIDVKEAVQIVAEQIKTQLDSLDIDITLVYLSPHFRAVATEVADQLNQQLKSRVLLGCTAEGVIADSQEIEQASALAVIAAHLPEINLTPFSLQSMNWDNLLNHQTTFSQAMAAPPNSKLLMLLADPFTTPIDRVLQAVNNYYPGVPMIGGMASGAVRAGGNVLLLNEQIVNHGAVGVAFSGNFEVDVIVSQGCRPIGELLTVTEAKQNMILSLNGENPLAYLQRLVEQLSVEDQQLLQSGLYLGRAIATEQDMLGRGDFLVRGVMGIDQKNGAIVVTDYINEGEQIQFQLRDASTAKEDLEMMLTPQLFYDAPRGGFLFSCNGRGTRLYDHPHGDISAIERVIGDIDITGFFCAGEIGPIGGKNFLHGHTASLALFRPCDEV